MESLKSCFDLVSSVAPTSWYLEVVPLIMFEISCPISLVYCILLIIKSMDFKSVRVLVRVGRPKKETWPEGRLFFRHPLASLGARLQWWVLSLVSLLLEYTAGKRTWHASSGQTVLQLHNWSKRRSKALLVDTRDDLIFVNQEHEGVIWHHGQPL